MKDEPLKFSGYYIHFQPTGCFEIDLILSAVARAGKAYHHTDSWQDETPSYDPRFKGDCPQDWIQNAAIDAAKAMSARQGQDAKQLGATPASAVGEADLPETSSSGD